MNYLAHLYLSQNNAELMVGNYIADFVKGKDFEDYPDGIKKGILMHREIDTFTDSHPITLKSKERLYPNYGKYSPVIVDMFYDHILAKEWKDYSPIALASFSNAVYKTLDSFKDQFPPASARTLHYMSKGDWLSGYATLDGMSKALSGISQRANFENNMDVAVQDLEKNYALYKEEFVEFFPLIIKHLRPYF